MPKQSLKQHLEAILFAADQPLSVKQLLTFFSGEEHVSKNDINAALQRLQSDYEKRGVQLKEVASGYRFQTHPDYKAYVSKHWEEKTQKYSRALLETLAIIVYRQPVTRAEIEDIRGVSVSSNIIKTLEERNWIRTVGHKEVPGRPAMLGSAQGFLDYFNLKSLDQLPNLTELTDLDSLNINLDLLIANETSDSNTSADSA
jgi:segregation and condensation protein B